MQMYKVGDPNIKRFQVKPEMTTSIFCHAGPDPESIVIKHGMTLNGKYAPGWRQGGGADIWCYAGR